MQGYFVCFLLSVDFFIKNNVSIISFRNTIRMSIILDPGKDKHLKDYQQRAPSVNELNKKSNAKRYMYIHHLSCSTTATSACQELLQLVRYYMTYVCWSDVTSAC